MKCDRHSLWCAIYAVCFVIAPGLSNIQDVCLPNEGCDKRHEHDGDTEVFDKEFVDPDDGGWFTDVHTQIAKPGPCNIEIFDSSLTQQEFLRKYAKSAPIVLRKTSDNSNFKDLCRKTSILNNHGSKVVRLSSANTYSYDKVDVTLEKYINEIMKPQSLSSLGNETFYWFGDNNYTEWEDIFSIYKPPPYRLPGLTGVYSFGAAGAGTGVPFHYHGPGFAEVIFGIKRWFLYPPKQQPNFNPDKTTLHWLLEDYPKLPASQKPYECTLLPGDAIYFPDHWWHGTLNVNTSVFISTFLG